MAQLGTQAVCQSSRGQAGKAAASPYLGVVGAENAGVVGAAHHDLVRVLLGGVGGTGAVGAVGLGAMALPRHPLARGVPHGSSAAPGTETQHGSAFAHGLRQHGQEHKSCLPNVPCQWRPTATLKKAPSSFPLPSLGAEWEFNKQDSLT